MDRRISDLVALGFSLLVLLSLSCSFFLSYMLEQNLAGLLYVESLIKSRNTSLNEIKLMQLERDRQLSQQLVAQSARTNPPDLLHYQHQIFALLQPISAQNPLFNADWQQLPALEAQLAAQSQQILRHVQQAQPEAALALYTQYQRELERSLELIGHLQTVLTTEVQSQLQASQTWLPQSRQVANYVIVLFSLVSIIAALVLGRRVLRLVRRSQLAAQENQDIMEYTLDAICVFDDQGRFLRVNDACERIWGYRADELLGRACMELVYKDDFERTLAASQEILAGQATRNFQNRHYRKDGSIVSLMWSARWLEAQRQVFCVARDITDLHRAEEELKLSEERTRLIVATAQDAFMAMNAEGLITDWNPKAEQIFGWSAAEAIGQPMHELIIPLEFRLRHQQGLQRFLATGEGPVLNKRLELTALHRSGREIPVEFTISPIHFNGKLIFSAFLHEISERLQVEQELYQAKEQAEAASRAKSEFLANMSHEIRTPMNGVLGALSLSLDCELSDAQRELLKLAHDSGENLLNIINDILDFSKIEAGKLQLEHIGFDLLSVMEDVVAMVANKATDKHLELLVDYPESVPRCFLGDPGRIRQVLINLVNNALKFTEQGQVLLAVELVQQQHQQAELLVRVEDTGIGIEPDKLLSLFDKFTQADSSITRRYGGTGLGLAICKQLVELMGGQIGADSEPAKGSCFWFNLSLAMANSDAKSVATPVELAGLRVLVVDDNAVNRHILQQQLHTWQLRVSCAAGATEALSLLKQAQQAGEPFVVALLDYQMPDMDGEMLGRAIKADPELAATQLVLLTSMRPSSSIESLLAVGFSAYLLKPVKQAELLNQLSHLVLRQASAPAGLKPLLTQPKATSRLASFPGVKLLLVEDNSTNQLVASMMLENLGCQVDIAHNGQEAVAQVLAGQYQLIFMDCEMPIMDGFAATTVLRQYGVNLPIIAVTAQAMQGDRERCLACGMNDYLTKPVHQDHFAQMLERWLVGKPC